VRCVCEREWTEGGGGREREEDSEIQRIARETHLTLYLGARMGEQPQPPTYRIASKQAGMCGLHTHTFFDFSGSRRCAWLRPFDNC
jgi:hypothetical protein